MAQPLRSIWVCTRPSSKNRNSIGDKGDPCRSMLVVEDSPNAEDYIVRSHHNYLMERSVSVVLPDLPTGSYVVYLKVTSERDSNAQSVEQVVKREAADRTENKKLAQDQQKASACRQKVLRRWWEKRSINRDVTTQQSKNFEKRKGRRAEREAEQNFLNEEFNAMRLAKTEAETDAEARKKAEEAGDEALSKKTEEIEISEDKDEPVVVNEHHNGRDDAVISSMGSAAEGTGEKQEVPPVSGGPPASVKEEEPLSIPPRPAYDSTGESSDSPVEEWEALYSSDYIARKLRPLQGDQTTTPTPENAICIISVRVYSKDENLELRTVMEDGELLEGGMGSKGTADL
ncbi:hypothetical protein NOF04DRAFT_1350699 [Fusarium oxysporum II5]|nr:hypothetical protein NOF04DRAFT_1350699 [Fusarium oxysporum II5]